MTVNKQFFIDSITEGAIDGWLEHQVLPSITIAQAILESGWGESELAKKANNLFGIKASTDWQGPTIDKKTWEVVDGKDVTEVAAFRVYDDPSASVKDHGAFFTSTPWRAANYAAVIGERDYSKAAQALSDAGYATDPDYAKKLISIIEDYDLDEIDGLAFKDEKAEAARESDLLKRIEQLEQIIADKDAHIEGLEKHIEGLKDEQPEGEYDEVKRPVGYQRGGIETIEVIKTMLTPEEFRGYLKGNILKYRERAGHKPGTDEATDLAKALTYKEMLDELDKSPAVNYAELYSYKGAK